MSNWDGKSKGNALGYRIFLYALNKFGPRAAYFILLFVALYFVFFSPASTKATYSFLRKRMKFSVARSLVGIYRTYFLLGQSIIDKIAILSGSTDYFTYEFDGELHLQKLVDRGEGGLLISGHLGNWDIAANFLGKLQNVGTINVVAMDVEREQIKSLLEQHQRDKQFRIIPITEEGTHIFEIYKALKDNELVCIHADRYVEGQKTDTVKFFGDDVRLPIGPFKIISSQKKPFVFVYAVKETPSHYHLFSTDVQEPNRDLHQTMERYAANLEKKTRLYPYQWFNFYDFWG